MKAPKPYYDVVTTYICFINDFDFSAIDIQILPVQMPQEFQEEEEPKESQMDQSI